MQDYISTIARPQELANASKEQENVYDINDYRADYQEEHPAVYVGTYRKYNEGSLFGAWLDITKFEDYDEFISVCKFLHRDEEDPELMFQDYECFPESWYSESCMDEDTFNKIKEYGELDDDKQEAYRIYIDGGLGEEDIDSFNDAYMGKYDSEEDYAYEVINECYNIEQMMGGLSSYFDYKAYARDLFIDDYYFDNGHVFRRC